MHRERLIRSLLRSTEPAIRWKVHVQVLGESRDLPRIRRLEEEVRRSPRVRALLTHRNAPYRTGTNRSVYYKWQGIHWLLGALSEIGYPRGDESLKPLIDRSLEVWLRPSYFRTFTPATDSEIGRRVGLPVIEGRVRHCASMQGYALRYVSALGWPDARCRRLAGLLQDWQWPDGGWNCDVDPAADTSSFMETLLPLRGLGAYADVSGDRQAIRAARAAAEVFLERRLFRRRSDGKVIKPDFVRLHYPLYWHYDVLGGLKGMAEVGLIQDPRCAEALDWLESKEIPERGWPAEARYYRVSRNFESSSEFMGWGPTGKNIPNEWVTTDALLVLSAAGRLNA
ncbi:MAG: hypothetical protein L3K14_10190 [Thermoplasmata archaeon]|nr:hypothetical protein [Thermoplasmata archaeon]